MDLELPETVVNKDKMPAHNERFGATAAGRAALKGSAGKPPLRQAAIPLYASRRRTLCERTRWKKTEQKFDGFEKKIEKN